MPTFGVNSLIVKSKEKCTIWKLDRQFVNK